MTNTPRRLTSKLSFHNSNGVLWGKKTRSMESWLFDFDEKASGIDILVISMKASGIDILVISFDEKALWNRHA